MFWRQIPRATDVLGRAQDLESTAFAPVSSSSRRPVDEPHRPTYSSREGGSDFDGKKEWRKVIREVIDDEREKNRRNMRHVTNVVDAAIAHDRDKKGKLKGPFARLRRRSSAARLGRPLLDDDEEQPDPITLAKITPFSESPPASLCCELPDLADDSKVSPSQEPGTNIRTASSSAEPRNRRAASVSSSDDDSTLPPYEPGPVRPELDRQSSLPNTVSRIAFPPLPPAPPVFEKKQLYVQHRSYSAGMIPKEEPRRGNPARNLLPPSSNTAKHRPKIERFAYHRRYGVAGLSNFGNSCYLSAVIQALAATIPLSEFLSSGEFRRELKRDFDGTGGQIAEALSVLLQAMSNGRHRVITARRFRDIISSSSPFDNFDQQDAHEFLLYLLDSLHEELNLVDVPPSGQEQFSEDNHDNLPEVVAADRAWAAYRDQNDSIVIDFFQGQLRNRMECLCCGETSTTYSPLQSLPLPIPDLQQDEQWLQLEDCLDEFLRAETLQGDNAWNCPDCRRPQTASKRMVLTRLPQMLIFQLKRFSYSTLELKVETPVDFPLDGLELGHLLPPNSIETHYRLNLPHSRDTSYELYAIVNHLGGENDSGHYTAVVRKDSVFLDIDDETVAPVPIAEVARRYASSAYLLFYRLAT
ncbi:ubiquitin carboxyl-terminal hydrolase [Sporobolomyces koalae]|uniref:ubiquitin carboxyl-terminal hydrolase n=1 Tax=Sporobolomyces koalae TaxID=500713 RepID=UPI0031740616